MAEEDNKDLIRRFVEAIPNGGDLDAAEQFLAADCVVHFPTLPDFKGLQAFKDLPLMIRGAFPDLHETIEDLVAEGDKVVERFTLRGTHRGEFMGIQATGVPVSWTVIAIYRIEKAKIAEIWIEANLLSLTFQLGVLPSGS